MPVIKSAIKKLRKDRKREEANDKFRYDLKQSIKNAKKSKKATAINKANSILDKAVKKNIVHKSKAARVKSSLSKLAKPEGSKSKTTKPETKKAAPKKTKKSSK